MHGEAVARAFDYMIKEEEKIIWNPAYRIDLFDDHTLLLCSELDKTVLKGAVFCALAPFLQEGHLSADQLVLELNGRIAPEITYFALLELEAKKLIQANSCLLADEIKAFCGLLQISENEAFQKLKSTKVYINGGDDLKSSFALLPIQLIDDPHQADLSVVCVRDYLQPELMAIDTDRTWLLCKPYGSEIWIGPIFEAKSSPCYHCLAARLKLNRLEEAYLQQKLQLESFFLPSHAMLETMKVSAWNLLATEVFKWIVLGKNEHLTRKIQTFNTITFEKQEHVVIKRPACGECGNPQPSKKTAVITLERKKNREGGLRLLSCEETVRNLSSFVSPITGVVRYLQPRFENARSPLHVYLSGSNAALPKVHNGLGLNSFRRNTGGKGTSEIAAKASGLCEALERISGVFHGDEQIVKASYQDLGGEAVPPDSVLLFSPNQLKNRKQLNDKYHSFWKIIPPLPEDALIDWTPLFSLTEHRMKYYPTSCCYYSVPDELPEWRGHADSNGCAAGNCLEEAILQGFLELVERDSVAIWWYNRLQCPEVDLASLQHPYIESLLEEYASRKREVWVLDITTDLEIPTFAALSRVKDSFEENIYMGFGAHLDAETALLRALTEMNQFLGETRFWEESLFGEGGQDLIDKKIVGEWMTQAKIADHSYLKGSASKKRAIDYAKWKSLDLLEAINLCRDTVEKRGMEFLVLDQTRPEIELKVVRVVVPGLRHFWPRFAPGRLYDVPVQMGILKAPLKECELNPLGLYL